MKKATRSFMFLLAITLAVASLFGCTASPTPAATSSAPAASAAPAESASSAPTTIDTSKFVTLSMYLLGTPAQDYDQMLEALNAKAKADLNCNVNVTWIGWGDYSTKYPLVLASGESIDLLYASNWLNFTTEAAKGAFLPIENLAPTYAPKSWAAQTDGMKKGTTVNGHVYALSPNFTQYWTMGYIVRGDLMDQMGLKAINNMDDFGTYCAGVIKYAPQLDPSGFDNQSNLDIYNQYALGYYTLISGLGMGFPLVTKEDPTTGMPDSKVVNYYDDPSLPAFFTKMQQWYKAGYWPSNVLSNKDTNMLQEGKAAAREHNYDTWSSLYQQLPASQDIRYYDAVPHPTLYSAVQDSMAIGAHAQNPERALMLIEKMRNDESYYDLMAYGRPDVDYTVENNMIKPVNSTVWAPEGYCNWGLRDTNFKKQIVGSPANFQDVLKQISAKGVETPFSNFAFDPTPVKTQVAAIQAVMTKYELPLALGYLPDPVAGLDTLKAQLKQAGIDAVQTEMQKQIDAFLAASK